VEDAIALGETLIDDKPETTSPSLLSAYAKACLEVPDRVSAALSAIQAARQQRPNSIDIEDLLIEAKAHFKLEDNTQAIEVASLSSRPPRDEQRLGYWLALRGVEAQALESAGRVSEAIERLKRVPTSLGNGLPARTSLDSTMGRLLWRSGQQREAAVWWERAVSGEGLSALNKARLLNNAACALYQVGDRGGAVQRWEDTYARFDRMRATLDMVRVAINLCVGYRELDRSDRAKAYGRWAIEGAAELNEAELQTVATGNLGDAFRDAGDHESAQQLYETAWGLACASELTLDKAEGSRRLLHLAVQGDWPDAQDYARRAMECAVAAEDPSEHAKLNALLARLAAQAGEVDETERLAKEASETLTREGDAGALAVVRLSLAHAWKRLGQHARARNEVERSRAWAIEHDHPLLQRKADDLLQQMPVETLDDGRLDLLLRLATEVSRERDLSRLLDHIASAALELVEGDHAFVLLCDKGEPEVVATATRAAGFDEARPSLSVVQRAIQQRREVIVADVSERADLRSRESVVSMSVRSVLCVPLVEEDHVLGAVYVDQTKGSVAELQQATRFMRALASHAAVAVSNARTLATAKRRAEWVAEAARHPRSDRDRGVDARQYG
jgi:tetratricopeptide (TPR) repeat protein